MKYSFLAPIVLMMSCATPYPIFTLQSQDNAYYLHGRSYIEKTKGTTKVKLSYERNIDRALIFDIEIENQSEDTILMNPEQIYAEIKSSSNGPPHFIRSINPETKLISLEQSIAREDAKQSNQAIWHLTEVTLEAAEELSSNSNESDYERRERWEQHDQAALRREAESANSDYRLLSLNDQRIYISEMMLRKTHMPAYSFINGKVQIPLLKSMRTIEVIVPVAQDTLRFSYIARRMSDS
ncbi:MAG: hypothetical protein KI790_13300 [Cyclobacteriaceae bacterium]|nr:hypothetical protein [Cyclobacteriaceae bacterium HetDA_MAG_MS6]